MAIWIQSLSLTLIYSLGQGAIMYAALWLVLRLVSTASSSVRYHLSLCALTVLLGWFAATWWQQYHALATAHALVAGTLQTTGLQRFWLISADVHGGYSSLLSSVQDLFPWLSVLYMTGLAFMLLRLMGGTRQLFSLRRRGLSQPDDTVTALLLSLKSRLHIDAGVQLFISAKAQVPMVIGFLKPMILMPAAAMAQLSTEQLETILLHELAHIKRYDYLVNILQTVVETILFFNPFVWLASAIVRREREHCCDDLVLDHTQEPISYATALAAVAAAPGVRGRLAVAASGQSYQLLHRITRIMEMKRNPFSYSRMVAAVVILVAITASVAWLTPSFARVGNSKVKTTIPELVPANAAAAAGIDESSLLVQRLVADRKVSQGDGFVVEKRGDLLLINGKQQPADETEKYLKSIKQADIRVQVHSLQQRMEEHLGAGTLQLLAPVESSSQCIDYGKKAGC